MLPSQTTTDMLLSTELGGEVNMIDSRLLHLLFSQFYNFEIRKPLDITYEQHAWVKSSVCLTNMIAFLLAKRRQRWYVQHVNCSACKL